MANEEEEVFQWQIRRKGFSVTNKEPLELVMTNKEFSPLVQGCQKVQITHTADYEVEEKTNDPHVISELPAKAQFPLCNLYTKKKVHRVEAVVALHKPCRNKFTFCIVLTSPKV
jgi:hypothetical protein